MTTPAFRDLLDEMAARLARCSTNVERPSNVAADQPLRHRAVSNSRLTEEDREYLRRWQSEMESFDRF